MALIVGVFESRDDGLCALVGAAKLLEPVENRNVTSVLLVEDDVSSRLTPYLYTIAILLCLKAVGAVTTVLSLARIFYNFANVSDVVALLQ